MAISRQTAIRVWTAAGCMCSFPGCQRDLLAEEAQGLLGDLAHIVASSRGGPRGASGLSAAERDSATNLILLCPTHHRMVDANANAWSADRLREAKTRHEAWVRTTRELGDPGGDALGTAFFMNVRRILLDPAARGLRQELDGLNLQKLTGFDGMANFDVLRLITAVEELLRRWNARALPLAAPTTLAEENIGGRVRFTGRFFTKNVPGSRSDHVEITPDIERGPHLWTKVGARRVLTPLDPRWFTSSSSYTWFRSGNSRFALIGNLMDVNADSAVIAPLVVGLPTPEWAW